MIIFQYRIYKTDLEINPTVFYCFGDNDERRGKGGQAKECRGMPNAIGIRTKKSPDTHPSSYYTDDEYEENIRKIGEDFRKIEELLKLSKVVVLPTEGFGTGLAELKTRAPRTLKFIESKVMMLVERY